MIRKDITITKMPDGEVSAAALVVQRAGKFSSAVYIEKNDRKINAKSIMGVMTVPLTSGETLTITADGPDEEDAIAQLTAFLAE